MAAGNDGHTHGFFQEPLRYWREHEMPKVTQNPTALLGEDGGLVEQGDVLAIQGAGQAPVRRVKLITVIPDEEGLVTVSETYRIEPEKLGLLVRPETVILELSREEAQAVIAYYRRNHTSDSAVAVLDELTSTIGDQRER